MKPSLRALLLASGSLAVLATSSGLPPPGTSHRETLQDGEVLLVRVSYESERPVAPHLEVELLPESPDAGAGRVVGYLSEPRPSDGALQGLPREGVGLGSDGGEAGSVALLLGYPLARSPARFNGRAGAFEPIRQEPGAFHLSLQVQGPPVTAVVALDAVTMREACACEVQEVQVQGLGVVQPDGGVRAITTPAGK